MSRFTRLVDFTGKPAAGSVPSRSSALIHPAPPDPLRAAGPALLRPVLLALSLAMSGSTLLAQGTINQEEPDDSILLANDTGFVAGTSGLKVVTGHSSDGDYGATGNGSGDFDFFKIPANAGQTILLDLKNAGNNPGFDSFLALYRYDGTTAVKVAENDDITNGTVRSSRLTYTVPASGD